MRNSKKRIRSVGRINVEGFGFSFSLTYVKLLAQLLDQIFSVGMVKIMKVLGQRFYCWKVELLDLFGRSVAALKLKI